MSANERAAGDPTDEEKYGKIPEQGEFCVYGIVRPVFRLRPPDPS